MPKDQVCKLTIARAVHLFYDNDSLVFFLPLDLLDRFELDTSFCLIETQGLHNITVFYQVYCSCEYSAHLNFTMTFGKKIFLFIKNNFTRIIHSNFIHHKSHLKPFLSYLPCREYFSIIFNV